MTLRCESRLAGTLFSTVFIVQNFHVTGVRNHLYGTRWLTLLILLLMSLFAISACSPTPVKTTKKRPTDNADAAYYDVDDFEDAQYGDTNPSDSDSGNTGGSAGDPCNENDPQSCAAGLFCASLNGEPAQCIPEHTLDDGASCTEHNQCASRRCNLETGRCASSPGAVCTEEDGCGPGASGLLDQVCVDGVCQPDSGDNGAVCTEAQDCLSGICKNNKCVPGNTGDSCDVPEHCQSNICAMGVCSDGETGDSCNAPEHCKSNICAIDTCSNGENGDACIGDTDCQSQNCVDGACEGGGPTTPDSCESDEDCEKGRCIANQCSEGTMGAFCEETADCQGGLHCNSQCPEEHCIAICTDGQPGSPCITSEGCQEDFRCTDETPWQAPGALFPFNTCAAQEFCDFHLRDCDDEDDWCMRTADGNICGHPGNGQHLAPCTDDTDCRSGVCSDHGFGNFKCSQNNGWGAPCTVVSVPGEPPTPIGCDAPFVCDTTIGPPDAEGGILVFGHCGAQTGYLCYSKFESTDVTFNHRGGCAPGGVEACVPSPIRSKYCEHNPSISCSTDKDCACYGIELEPGQLCPYDLVPGKQCVTDYVCP